MRMNMRQFRKYVRRLVESIQQTTPTKFGWLRASIAGDARYTDTLTLWYNPADDTVTVTVDEGSPAGGMDSFTPSVARHAFSTTVPARPREVMSVVKDVVGDDQYNFKKYGKPTKNFRWNSDELVGLNIGNLTQALSYAKDEGLEEDY